MSRIVSRGFGGGNPGAVGSTIVTQGYGEHPGGASGPSTNMGLQDPRRDLLAPGIRFANVPRGQARYVQKNENGTRVEHVNTLMGVIQTLTAKDPRDLSGVIRFRPRGVPASIVGETRNLDRFGNLKFPFTGS